MNLSDFSIPGLNLLKKKVGGNLTENHDEATVHDKAFDENSNATQAGDDTQTEQENQQNEGILKTVIKSVEHASEDFVHALEQDRQLLDQDESTVSDKTNVNSIKNTGLDFGSAGGENAGTAPTDKQAEDVHHTADPNHLLEDEGTTKTEKDEKSSSVEETVTDKQNPTVNGEQHSAFELALAGHKITFDDEQGKFHVQETRTESSGEANEEKQSASGPSSSEEEEDSDDDDSGSSSSSSSEGEDEEDQEIGMRPTMMEDNIDEGGGHESPVRSKNELEDQLDDSYLERLHIPPETPLEPLGEISHVVENNTVIIRGITSGEIRVLDEDTVVVDTNYNILGRVYETLGRVEEPYYSLKFATIKPVEEKNFRQRVNEQVFYVSEKASVQVLSSAVTKFVLTEQLRALKGSDASNIHDEEISESDAEFSSDEAEQLYKARRKAKRKEAAGGGGSGGRQQSNNTHTNNNNNINKRFKAGANPRSKLNNDKNNPLAADARQRAYTSMPSRYGNGASSGMDSGDLYTPLSRPSSAASVNFGNERRASPSSFTAPYSAGWINSPQQQYYQQQQQQTPYRQEFYPPAPPGYPMGVPPQQQQQQQYMSMDGSYMTPFQHEMMPGSGGYQQAYYQQQQQLASPNGGAGSQIYQQVQQQLEILRRSSSSQGDQNPQTQ